MKRAREEDTDGVDSKRTRISLDTALRQRIIRVPESVAFKSVKHPQHRDKKEASEDGWTDEATFHEVAYTCKVIQPYLPVVKRLIVIVAKHIETRSATVFNLVTHMPRYTRVISTGKPPLMHASDIVKHFKYDSDPKVLGKKHTWIQPHCSEFSMLFDSVGLVSLGGREHQIHFGDHDAFKHGDTRVLVYFPTFSLVHQEFVTQVAHWINQYAKKTRRYSAETKSFAYLQAREWWMWVEI